MLKKLIEGAASIRIRHILDAVEPEPTPEASALLLESGDAMLLESGDRILLE